MTEGKVSLHDLSLPEIFEKGGLLSRVINGYEPRLPQIEAADTIQKSFDNMQHALIEAGTGTGKSFIVLFAAVMYAIKTGKKAVLSLPSQILQEQLFKSDVPEVLKMLEYVKEDVKFALAIGRGNFVSIRRVTELFNAIKEQMKENGHQNILTESQLREFKLITESLNNPKSLGYKGDVDFEPDPQLWARINSSSTTCLGKKCPMYEQCYYQKNRKKVKDADVIITNNALLFTDMAQKAEIGFDKHASLPPYHLLVFDEAHNLEKDATNYFKKSVSYEEMLQSIMGLQNNNFLMSLLDNTNKSQFNTIISEIKTVLKQYGKYVFPFMDKKHRQELSRNNKKFNGNNQDKEIVLNKSEIDNMVKYFKGFQYVFAKYSKVLKDIDKNFKKIMNPSKKQMLIHRRFLSIKNKVDDIVKKIDFIFENHSEEDLYFLEKGFSDSFKGVDKFPTWKITKTPVNLGKIFQKNMFNTCDHVIALSATISTNNDFKFFRSRLGFTKEDKVQELIVSSPFDYPKQGKVYLFENSPPANSKDFDDFLAQTTFQVLSKTSGGTFMLFTSNASMNNVYKKIATRIEHELNIKCLIQGQDSKSVIIKRFKEYQRSDSGYKSAILFAGTSFWEGVSVEGNDLMNIIVTKLPFPVPTDPIIAARCNFLEEQGLNPFNDYLIPLATIPLKQGFGRLIRKISDRGNIFMMDNRLVKARYRHQILNSLPNFSYHKIKF